MLDGKAVENACILLSPLQKTTIRQKVLKFDEPPTTYSVGEALVFWLADLLTRTKLLTADQLRLVIEEFAGRIKDFGRTLEAAFSDSKTAQSKRLPICRIGFMDRTLSCMDGEEFFLDLQNGGKITATDTVPLETITFNLTALFIKTHQHMTKHSVQLNSKEVAHEK